MDEKLKERCVIRGNQELIQEYINNGININITDRWEKGIKHHPRSIELMKHLETIDFVLCNDYFHWSIGGDGDNGEILMYQMDMYFELKDK